MKSHTVDVERSNVARQASTRMPAEAEQPEAVDDAARRGRPEEGRGVGVEVVGERQPAADCAVLHGVMVDAAARWRWRPADQHVAVSLKSRLDVGRRRRRTELHCAETDVEGHVRMRIRMGKRSWLLMPVDDDRRINRFTTRRHHLIRRHSFRSRGG